MPKNLIIQIGTNLIYLLSIGRKDFSGDDWGDVFAEAVGGIHLSSPVGIADVTLNGMAWSMKTVKNNTPFMAKTVRLISGRCSPDYSYGITDPHQDIQNTGRAVLGIWNGRINIAQDNYTPVRTLVLLRSPDLCSYCMFEEENHRYRTSDYRWEENHNGNLIGIDIETNDTCFTWQPHGSQFTIHTHVPKNAVRFSLKRPPQIAKEDMLRAIKFDPSWIEIQ